MIRLWTTRNGRWMSPKYLCGESYGTDQGCRLARYLQERYGMYLNGLMLVSAGAPDFGTAEFIGGNDEPYVMYLPTYAAVAHYHGKHGDRPLHEVLAAAQEYAERDYRWVLGRGARLTGPERAAAAARIARADRAVGGLRRPGEPAAGAHQVLTELLRDRRLVVGRIDGRFTGWDTDYGREMWSSDASIDAIVGPYTAALNHYVRAELGYASDLPYEVLTERVHPWSFKEFENAYVFVQDKLSAAMRANPHMRLHVDCGYHDLATPYYAAEHSFAHLQVPAELVAKIEYSYYEAGHMMYLHEPSLAGPGGGAGQVRAALTAREAAVMADAPGSSMARIGD